MVAFLTRCPLLSSQTMSLVFFLYPKPRAAAVWRVAAVGNEGGKCLLPFPSELALSHKWFTYWWSPQMPSMCSQVLPCSTCSPSRCTDRSHGPPTEPGGIVTLQGALGPLWKPADLMCTTHTPSCCRTDAATSKENLQSYFPARDDECGLVFFSFPRV